MTTNLFWAVGVNLDVARLGYGAQTVSRSGAIGGAAIGTVIYAAAGLGAWI